MKAIALALAVSALNVLLNRQTRHASSAGTSLYSAVLSLEFATAFLIGLTSVLCLMAFYRTGENFAQGILIMGTGSMLIGAIVGHFDRNPLGAWDWILFATVATVATLRFVFKTS